MSEPRTAVYVYTEREDDLHVFRTTHGAFIEDLRTRDGLNAWGYVCDLYGTIRSVHKTFRKAWEACPIGGALVVVESYPYARADTYVSGVLARRDAALRARGAS